MDSPLIGRSRQRSTAMARAEHGAPPVHLTKAEVAVLEEALRKGEDLREEVESAVRALLRATVREAAHAA